MALETTYTCTSKKGGQLFFKFDLNGYLIEFKYSGRELTEVAADYVHKMIPKRQEQMAFYEKSKGFEVVIGEPDLSFDVFWNAYDNKSKKQDCIKLWKSLSEDHKYNAIAFIKRFRSWSRMKGYGFPLPDTYLRKKRWLDEL